MSCCGLQVRPDGQDLIKAGVAADGCVVWVRMPGAEPRLVISRSLERGIAAIGADVQPSPRASFWSSITFGALPSAKSSAGLSPKYAHGCTHQDLLAPVAAPAAADSDEKEPKLPISEALSRLGVRVYSPRPAVQPSRARPPPPQPQPRHDDRQNDVDDDNDGYYEDEATHYHHDHKHKHLHHHHHHHHLPAALATMGQMAPAIAAAGLTYNPANDAEQQQAPAPAPGPVLQLPVAAPIVPLSRLARSSLFVQSALLQRRRKAAAAAKPQTSFMLSHNFRNNNPIAAGFAGLTPEE